MSERRVQLYTAIGVVGIAAVAVVIWLVVRRPSTVEAPDRAKFDAMTAQEQCAATASRGVQCVDELLVARTRALAPGELADALADDIEKKPSTSTEDRAIHDAECHASPGYARAIVTCWNVDGCEAFARCVVAEQGKSR